MLRLSERTTGVTAMLKGLDIADRPEPGHPMQIEPGLRRILARNPSPMTHWGTNTYLLGENDVAVIDPGPDDPDHLAAILEALGGARVSHILVTHAHRDHSPLARRLAAATGAPVMGFGPAAAGRTPVMEDLARQGLIGGGEGVDHGFAPDVALADGTVIEGAGWQLTAIWTPGHFAGHLSFDWNGQVFSGDHVMGWASTLISPPDGDVTSFMASCARLRALDPVRFHPGHGAPVDDPLDRLDWLMRHRREREAQILAALGRTPLDLRTLARRIYHDAPSTLLPAAERNVLAHLVDLEARGLVRALPKLGTRARFVRN
jgi:glyoxylase-like metal-dependent hydrolase (beta-lactamase superfamily II)